MLFWWFRVEVTSKKETRNAKIAVFQEEVLAWFAKHGRDLPWRRTSDPYKIMVSEIMLQQTQVDRVIPKYHAFLEKFPDLQSLASGSSADVLRLWSGLGYNSRALRLQRAVQMIVKVYEGKFPAHVDALLKLPGIGPYTARSVLIFAFNKDLATVDTNIRRILVHEFSDFGVNEETGDKELFVLAEECLPYGRSREWHNALMDYGSAVLTSRRTGIGARTKQSKFKGSRRWFRGDLLKRLVAGQELSVSELCVLWAEQGKDEAWVSELVLGMERQGLVSVEEEGKIKLKE